MFIKDRTISQRLILEKPCEGFEDTERHYIDADCSPHESIYFLCSGWVKRRLKRKNPPKMIRLTVSTNPQTGKGWGCARIKHAAFFVMLGRSSQFTSICYGLANWLTTSLWKNEEDYSGFGLWQEIWFKVEPIRVTTTKRKKK